MRLKSLLGVSPGGAEDAADAPRRPAPRCAPQLREDVEPERERELLEEALGHIDRQLELVRRRAGELASLEQELCETRRRVKRRLSGAGHRARAVSSG